MIDFEKLDRFEDLKRELKREILGEYAKEIIKTVSKLSAEEMLTHCDLLIRTIGERLVRERGKESDSESD